ncbi:hypothetical protein I4F81_001315 [Pyropia yezoensis]|uniref:Uncharacterized protein n=1 Tax=Pyropia yezoensis TaxID=2788 RepID=A0ACC3BLU9_PYRYE|nr:hypothetical protein I4F81_001315 [Neopyropia yezoensis]
MDGVLSAPVPLRHNEYVAAVTKIRRHYARGKSKSRVVMGDAAVEYMVSRGLAATIADAEALGRRMANDRIWVHVSGRVEFLAAHRLYRFEQATVAETRLAIEAARVAAAAAAAALDKDDCVSDDDESIVDGDGGSTSGGEGGTRRSSSVRTSSCRPSTCGVRTSGGGSVIKASASFYSVRGGGRRGSIGSERSRPSLQLDVGALGVGGGLLVEDDWDSPPCCLPETTTAWSNAATARRCSSLHSDHTEAADPRGARRASVTVPPSRSMAAGGAAQLSNGGNATHFLGGGPSVDRGGGDGGGDPGRTSGEPLWERELLLHHSSSINSSGTPSRHASVTSTDGAEDGGPAAAGRPPFVRTPFGSADPSRRASLRAPARWSLTALGTALTRTVSRSGDHRRASTASRPSAASPPRAQAARLPALGRAASGVAFNHPRDSLSDPYADTATVGVGRLQGVASAPVVGPSDLWPPLPARAGGDDGLDEADAELAAFAAQQSRRSRRRSLVRPHRRRSLGGASRGTVPSREHSGGGAGWAAGGGSSGAAASAAAAAAAVAAATATAAAAASPPSPAAAAARRRRFSSVAPGAADADAGGARAVLARASRRWLRRLRPRPEGAAAANGRADAGRQAEGEELTSRR